MNPDAETVNPCGTSFTDGGVPRGATIEILERFRTPREKPV
jgi:hypothetical protein